MDAKKPSMGFAETCGAAFEYGPKRLRPWANFARYVRKEIEALRPLANYYDQYALEYLGSGGGWANRVAVNVNFDDQKVIVGSLI